ncbi:hypothetical protein K2173_004180 [Erythroxylum novogranatense]|uniref:Uncharacterized protein n=1 Tax=Erythroxylum novogranatense TaxID=1862640 RepID=A0AAV8SYU7_9ROSI|nr:hypothetical protein K2173_004180 [Erythroxylum novogranatense]
MEDHCSPLSWGYIHQDEGIEELRHYLFYTSELETTILSAQEEITKREFDILHLKDLLCRTIKERNESQEQCQKLLLEKLSLQQLLQKQQECQHQHQQHQQEEEIQFPKQETAPLSGITYSSEDESRASDSKNRVSSPESNRSIVSSQSTDPISHQQQFELLLPQSILKLVSDKPLPEKGKLLQAVKEAGPLLKNLLLAGPLPQWQHPPPQLNSVEIPPVAISSPTAKLVRQDSFNSLHGCLSKNKRSLELCESPDASSPSSKSQKMVLH